MPEGLCGGADQVSPTAATPQSDSQRERHVVRQESKPNGDEHI